MLARPAFQAGFRSLRAACLRLSCGRDPGFMLLTLKGSCHKGRVWMRGERHSGSVSLLLIQGTQQRSAND
jgi:hypothetical protein